MSVPFIPLPVEELLERLQEDLFQRWKLTLITLLIWEGKPKSRFCLELGFALVFDRPIVVLVTDPKQPLPVNLRRCACVVVEGGLSDPQTSENLNRAIGEVIINDRRVRR